MNEDPNNVPPVTPDEPEAPVMPETPETPEVPETPEIPEVPETPEMTPEQLKAANKKLFERAKKAEADLKAFKAGKTPAPARPATPASSQPNVEETVLLANGMDEELLAKLKTVAKVNGIASLIKAQNDPIFVAVKVQFEKDKKVRDASLPPTRGAGSVTPKKDFNTPGLTKDEHKKMFLDAMNK